MVKTVKNFTDNYEGETAIICGSAPCLVKEYEKVVNWLRQRKVKFKVIGINEAVKRIYCDFLMSYHAEKIDSFKKRSLNKDIETHTSNPLPFSNKEILSKVDYVWKGIFIGATSAGDAIQICDKMGFDEIIMVGCPMNGGDGYFYAPKAQENVDGCPRFGNLNKDNGFIKSHQKKLIQLKEKMDISKVRSMSGFSASVFGKPNLEVDNG